MRRILAVTVCALLGTAGIFALQPSTASAALTSHQRAIASASGAYSTATFSATVPSGTTTVAGRHIVVVYMFSSAGQKILRSVTDSKGNAYTIHVTRINSGNSNLAVAIASARLSKPLVAGDRITAIQSAASNYHSLSSFEFDNFVSAGWADRMASGNTSTAGTVVATGMTPSTTQPNETLVAGTAFGDSTASLTSDAPWLTSASLSASASKVKSLTVAVREVSTIGAYRYSGNLSTPKESVSALVTFRTTALSPTATTSPTATATSTATPTATPTATTATNTPLGVPGAWTAVFGDEFNGTAVDTSKWSTMQGWTTNHITAQSGNLAVSGGSLSLTLSSATEGAGISSSRADGAGVNGYLFPVGNYAEARVRFSGDGNALYNWPAWWTSGPNWPAAGEHDIAEVLSGALTVNYHSPSGAHNQGAISGYWGDNYHVYGVHRKANSADVYWDGRLVKSYPTDDNGAAESILFNMGKHSSGTTVYGSAGALRVDWVRVWRPAA